MCVQNRSVVALPNTQLPGTSLSPAPCMHAKLVCPLCPPHPGRPTHHRPATHRFLAPAAGLTLSQHFNALPAPGSTIEVTQHVPDYTGKLQTATFVVNGVSILDATKRTVAFSGLRHTVNVAAKHFQGAERRLGELRQAEVVQLGCYGKRGAKGAWRTRRA